MRCGGAARPRPPRRDAHAPDDDLRAVVRARVLDDFRRGVAAREDGGLRAELLRELHRPQDPLALACGKPLQRGRLDVDGRPFDAELRREARGAAHDVVAARAGPDAAEQRVLGLPDALDRLVRPVRLHVVFHAVGRAAQREFAQRHQVALAEEVARGPLDLLGQVHLAGREPRQQVVGRHVDHHDLVGLVEDRVGHGLPDVDARDAADDVVEALDVLHVERREHVDARGKQLVDVLPALRMPRARHVRVREFVDQDQRRVPRQRRIEVELLQRAVLVCDLRARQDRKVLQQRFGLLAPVRLEQPDDDVLALVPQLARRGQHRVRLADAGRRAEVDAEAAAVRGRLLRLHFGQQLVGIGAVVAHRRTVLPHAHPNAQPDGAAWRLRHGHRRPTRRARTNDRAPRPRYFAARSSARFNATTLTRGSPSSPNVRPSVCWTTSACTDAAGSPRVFATRAS